MDLKWRIDELPPGIEVIAYYRSPYCVLAYEAVATLRHHGIMARRVEDGFPEWRAAGYRRGMMWRLPPGDLRRQR